MANAAHVATSRVRTPVATAMTWTGDRVLVGYAVLDPRHEISVTVVPVDCTLSSNASTQPTPPASQTHLR